MTTRQILTTESVEAHRRLDFWRATLSNMYAPLDVKDCDVAGFRSSISSTQVGRLNVSQFDGVGQTISRQKHSIRSGHCDDYVAIIQLGGMMNHSTNDREHRNMPGSITLYDLSRPCELRAPDTLNIIDVSVPRKDFERAFAPAVGSVGLSIEPSQIISPLILDFFRSLTEYGHLLDEGMASRVARIGLDLLAAGYAERLGSEPLAASSAATFYRAKVFIKTNLGNSDLDVEAVAAAMKMSERRLHTIFAEHGLTIASFIWDKRLDRAKTLLQDAAHEALTVAAIAYHVGFKDPAHFTRRFRSHFSITPSECREEAQRRLQVHQDAEP